MKEKTKHEWSKKDLMYLNESDAEVRYGDVISESRAKLSDDALKEFTSGAKDLEEIKNGLTAIGNSLGDVTFYYNHIPIITLSKVRHSIYRKKGTIDYGFNYYKYNNKKEAYKCQKNIEKNES